jgi:hypothetical protein
MKNALIAATLLLAFATGDQALRGDFSTLVVSKGNLVAAVTYRNGARVGTVPDQVLTIGGSPIGPHGPLSAEPLMQLPPRPQIQSEPLSSDHPAVANTSPAANSPDFEGGELTPEALKDVLIPSASGVITLTPGKATNSAQDQVVSPHNPWGVRVATKETMLTFTIQLDGIIVGDQDPTKPAGVFHAVALINGLPIRKNETQIGPFMLQGIYRHAVIFNYDGTQFLIPEGRPITVRIPKG